MRRIALAVLALAAFPGEASAADRHPCEPRGSRTVEANAAARVFTWRDEVFACAYRRRTRVNLGLEARRGCLRDCGGVATLRLRRRFVAYQTFSSSMTASRAVVWRLDLAARRPRVIWNGRRFALYSGVTDLELAANGSLAWIATFSGSNRPAYEVWKADRAGLRVLDGGREIAEDSLALSGRTLYWMNADVPRSATLD